MTSNRFLSAAGIRYAALAATLGTLWFMAGCHSAFVQTTIVNQSGTSLRLVELDYPSASFGISNLDQQAEYHYRFKIQGSGSVKLQFVDAQGVAHRATGPELDEGQEGTLLVTINKAGNVAWTPTLTVSK